MGVEVGEEEAEEGELSDLTAATVVETPLGGSVDDAAAPPEVKLPDRSLAEGESPDGLPQLDSAVQVADNRNKYGPGDSRQIRAAGYRGRRPVSPTPPTRCQVVDDAERPADGQGEY